MPDGGNFYDILIVWEILAKILISIPVSCSQSQLRINMFLFEARNL